LGLRNGDSTELEDDSTLGTLNPRRETDASKGGDREATQASGVKLSWPQNGLIFNTRRKSIKKRKMRPNWRKNPAMKGARKKKGTYTLRKVRTSTGVRILRWGGFATGRG